MARSFAALESGVFDVLIVGGGITGAGVARDAAMRGMRVALVEKGSWASGTSSKSSRLVHGGIRYLEHGDIALVRESVREREILLRIAPELVKPLEFTWPVYRGARLPRWKLRIGLTIYDVLAGKHRGRRHQSLDTAGVLDLEPRISSKNLKGGASYFDAATDDAGLTRANIAAASRHGAVCVDHALMESATVTSRKSDGAHVRDMIDGGSVRVSARSIVSAIGPWQAKGTKGSHIEVPRSRIENNGAVTMISPDDGRVMFTLPSGDKTIFGTTDLRTDESPDDVKASESEIEYILRAANFYFPDARLSRDDVISTWAGIRPLAAAPPGMKPSSISREHRILRDQSGVIVVTGGKLTTYRSMASEIVDEVERVIGRAHVACRTDVEPLLS
jgi:glycerol-3-phosphate dehydrogenase